MDIKRFYAHAWVLVGAVVFALGSAKGDVGISSAPAPGAVPGVAVSTEPFINPFGTKKPKIVSGFGKRDVPPSLLPATIGPVQMVKEMHEGVDYRAFPGSAVKAARSGKVIFAGFSKMYVSRADKTDQHRLVIIRHLDGLSSRYVHLNALHVRPGMEVQSGQVLGMMAESDEWTEPVLHFEIRDIRGQALDPTKIILDAEPAAPGKAP